jgi:hypothetical protein
MRSCIPTKKLSAEDDFFAAAARRDWYFSPRAIVASRDEIVGYWVMRSAVACPTSVASITRQDRRLISL